GRLGRRALLRGSLVLAFALSGPRAAGQSARPPKLPGSLERNRQLDAWLRIGADGRVTLQTGKVELGQGILTALAQICADELDVDLSRISVVSGDTRRCPNEGVTAGSMSVPQGGLAVRHAAAEVRALLVEMASKRLGVPAARLGVRDGTVADPAGGTGVTYWALVGGRELKREATGAVAPKPPSARRIAGRSVPRRDLPGKLAGEPSFVHDLRPEGLAHGRVVRPPAHGAALAYADTEAVARLPGVLKVVRDGSFLGVIATKEWLAIKAAAALAASARWSESPALPADPYDWLLKAKTQDTTIENAPRPPGPAPARALEAVYRKPYVMHASVGPSCAVASWDGQTLTVDTQSQSVFETCEAIA
ncbi:MAG TPA: molybdopterin cofactor-binding domain-containing protein, partial [Polyangiaceae bacterium]|nr:molybdopterin cofactor-binding domain-containing protein [Polyangiaceae bacterium]